METRAAYYLAHSQNNDGNGVAELLRDHLKPVAERAAGFARPFNAEQQAYAAGLLHDVGKYSDQFLRRLEQPHREASRDHWSMGALATAHAYKDCGLLPALAIQGHHIGLQELRPVKDLRDSIAQRMRNDPDSFTETASKLIQERFLADGFSWPKVTGGTRPANDPAADMLDVRMLFSTLVDADFVETEAHFNGNAITPRCYRLDGPSLDFDKAIATLMGHIEALRTAARTHPMDVWRRQLLATCIAAATCYPPGLFTLSAPTGSGKTLAMLAFALHHAHRYGLRRIVLVMPFLNIIEQTARIYRRLFSEQNGFDPNTLIEHHSLADDRELDGTGQWRDGVANAHRLLAENWDVPIILTTSVQCLESLMAHRPSPCRKLHRLAGSVILFDEVQTLPPHLALATLATLSRLADPHGPYGSTVVFATATQPAFEVLHDRVSKFTPSGWQPCEIVQDAETMFAAASRRVRIKWRHTQAIDLDELANDLAGHRCVLCIVNLKRHAIQLATALLARGRKGVCHLSTNMCPAHRTEVLQSVKDRLQAGKSVRLIATQCVEAGVDVDFPLVYRALAPLEAIAQAAGRCNRHGQRDTEQVVVFRPHDDRGQYPPGYGAGVDATATFLAMLGQGECCLDDMEIINSPEQMRKYFRQLYGLSGRDRDEQPDERPLLDAIREGNFPEVAKQYRLIRADTINVLVRYKKTVFADLADRIRSTTPRPPGFVRDWMRRASPHAVGLFRPQRDAALWNHLEPVQFSRRFAVDIDQANWFISLPGLDYDQLLGILCPDDSLIV